VRRSRAAVAAGDGEEGIVQGAAADAAVAEEGSIRLAGTAVADAADVAAAAEDSTHPAAVAGEGEVASTASCPAGARRGLGGLDTGNAAEAGTSNTAGPKEGLGSHMAERKQRGSISM
jgi:hypothetical protein